MLTIYDILPAVVVDTVLNNLKFALCDPSTVPAQFNDSEMAEQAEYYFGKCKALYEHMIAVAIEREKNDPKRYTNFHPLDPGKRVNGIPNATWVLASDIDETRYRMPDSRDHWITDDGKMKVAAAALNKIKEPVTTKVPFPGK